MCCSVVSTVSIRICVQRPQCSKARGKTGVASINSRMCCMFCLHVHMQHQGPLQACSKLPWHCTFLCDLLCCEMLCCAGAFVCPWCTLFLQAHAAGGRQCQPVRWATARSIMHAGNRVHSCPFHLSIQQLQQCHASNALYVGLALPALLATALWHAHLLFRILAELKLAQVLAELGQVMFIHLTGHICKGALSHHADSNTTPAEPFTICYALCYPSPHMCSPCMRQGAMCLCSCQPEAARACATSYQPCMTPLAMVLA